MRQSGGNRTSCVVNSHPECSIAVHSASAELYLISRTGGQNELAVRVEAQTVDLCGVGVDCVAGFGCGVGPGVPSGGGLRRVSVSLV